MRPRSKYVPRQKLTFWQGIEERGRYLFNFAANYKSIHDGFCKTSKLL